MGKFREVRLKKGTGDFFILLRNLFFLLALTFLLLYLMPKEKTFDAKKLAIQKEEFLVNEEVFYKSKDKDDSHIANNDRSVNICSKPRCYIVVDINKNIEEEILRIQNTLFDIESEEENITISVMKIRVGAHEIEKFKIGPFTSETRAQQILTQLILKNIFGKIHVENS